VATVVLVVSDRAAVALDSARARGIPVHQFSDFRDSSEWLAQLEAVQADLLVLAGYLKLVPAEVVSSWSNRIINIHPALLPRHGGLGMYGGRVHQAVIAAGDPVAGATVHLVDDAYDRGAILGQGVVPVRGDDTAESLASRVLEVEHHLLPAAVRAAALAGKPVPFEFPQGVEPGVN
jgi:folate-dependent phosphoribosylglycinamide formyltransferase PurN